MATHFGISELRSRFGNWRLGRKEEPEPAKASKSSLPQVCRAIEDTKGASDLSLLIENLVIPKLIADRDNTVDRLGLRAKAEAVGTDRKRPISSSDVATFTALTTHCEAVELLDFVDNCLATGSSVEAIYVDLLAPAARRLGEFWEDDLEDFVDVTMGLWRIQEIVRELSMRVPSPLHSGHGQRSALLSSMPGEQHSLGTLMVAECFQRAGWDTDVLIEPSQSELTHKVAERHYDVIGLTLSVDYPTGDLSGLIKSIRSVSSNPGTCVMIGGRLVNENPDMVDHCGADGTAGDAAAAVAIASLLVPAKAVTSGLLA